MNALTTLQLSMSSVGARVKSRAVMSFDALCSIVWNTNTIQPAFAYLGNDAGMNHPNPRPVRPT
ncbi:MAG: hypothetical protein GY708_21840 [Actinomycetia bacterium]|nr:hypothetical protein [Actinomycetes bacterium]MCP4958638.1 hypothetical protein [Actinomycetes bacterium]